VLVKQQQLRPHIEILEPATTEPLSGARVTIRARIAVPAGERLVPPKAFANGVVATGREQVSQGHEGTLDVYEFRWNAALPADRRVLIQVLAGTDSGVLDQQHVLVQQQPEPAKYRPRLFIVAAGINDYRDSRLPHLSFAVNNAQQFVDTLRLRSRGLYESRAVSLVDQHVTRPVWNITMQRFAEGLTEAVRPDDLLVIFLSGHGVRDPLAGGYYYVTADADYDDIRSGRFVNCLSFEDFGQFGAIPCRKLVILDTCHSGAIQPLEQRELKAALRALQEDVFLTLSATEGGQEAVEERTKRFGRFTFRLLEGLRGAADQTTGNRDGQVSLPEIVAYVQRTVAADSARDAQGQFPTAGPSELLELVNVPLTLVPPAAASKRVP
jgi:hypothetical protein